MSKKIQNHFLSLAIVVIFFFIASSSAVNKFQNGAFNYDNKVEDNDGYYIVLNDGTKIKGNNIEGQWGLLAKDIITIDNKKFAMKEVKGYRNWSGYYARAGKDYIKRIVHGSRINIYVSFTEVNTQSKSTGLYNSYTSAYHFAQKGENGPFVVIRSQKSIKELVADCPLAVQMADKSNGDIKKAIKNNSNYLNRIFDVYNNDCKE
jgi:hypothetical protein